MGKHFTLPYDGGLIEKNLPAGFGRRAASHLGAAAATSEEDTG